MPPKTRKRPAASTPQATKRPRRQQHTVSEPPDIGGLTLPELKALPAEVLRLHLSNQNLVTTGSVAAMASRLHSALQRQLPNPSNTTPDLPLAQLQHSVQDLVDKSLEGLQGRLLESIQGMLRTPSGAPTDPGPGAENPGTTADHAENSSPNQQDNISLPSVNPGMDPQPADSVLVSGVEPARPVPLPPVTPKMKQRIIKGEYIDFDQLLPESMFPSRYNTNSSPSITLRLSSDPSSSGDNVIVTQPRAANKRTVTDLSSWFEAWNVYAAVIVAHYPARASAILAYQRIICDASSKSLPQAWLKYDSRFRSLAAADKCLRWDQKANDLWLECFTLTSPAMPSPHSATTASASTPPATSKPISRVRRPCTYCGSLSHFPDNCTQNPFRGSRHPSVFTPIGGRPNTRDPSTHFTQRPQPPSERTSIPIPCRDFNNGVCSRAQSCRFRHVCANCGDNAHSKRDCPRCSSY